METGQIQRALELMETNTGIWAGAAGSGWKVVKRQELSYFQTFL